MSFDAESPETREAVAREASRSKPGGIAFAELTPQMIEFYRRLIAAGQYTDHPDDREKEPA
jgi:hypothetical protein